MKTPRLLIRLALILLLVPGGMAAETIGFWAGKIEAIDVPARTLTVRGVTSVMAFLVADDAEVVGADRRELSFSDLKVGAGVTVDYTRDSGVPVAHTITLDEPAPPPLPPVERPIPLRGAE